MLPDTNAYHQRMEAVRARMLHSTTVKAIVDENAHPDVLLSWLIHFTTRGVRMTEPVEGWIRRAGERCTSIGLEDIGRQLEKHSAQERDHHLLMIEDAKRLVARWNAAHETQIDADRLLDRAPTDAMNRYVELHEDVIASDTPFLQVAIEREIEGLSISVGPAIIQRCREVLGEEGMAEISFIAEHVELDVGHTAFNEKLLAKVLKERPEAMDDLVEAGTNALETYTAFMTDCIDTSMQS